MLPFPSIRWVKDNQPLEATLPAGEYRVEMGIYSLETMERLPPGPGTV
jgi:hypothetical protein